MSGFFESSNKISYPEADRLASDYVDEKAGQRTRTTSKDLLEWAEISDTPHNRQRAHDALERICRTTGANWAGRTVFQLPDDSQP